MSKSMHDDWRQQTLRQTYCSSRLRPTQKPQHRHRLQQLALTRAQGGCHCEIC